VAQGLALLGVYSLVLAAIGKQLVAQGKVSFQGSMVEFAVVTLVFIGVAVFVFTRPARAPLE
jgi:hypothetical protein